MGASQVSKNFNVDFRFKTRHAASLIIYNDYVTSQHLFEGFRKNGQLAEFLKINLESQVSKYI